MKVLKAKRKNNTYQLEIEASTEILEKAFESAFKKLVKQAKVPGFRKGKVPRGIFEKHYGKGHIIQEGIMLAINDAYQQALDSENIDAIDYPKNLDVEEYKEDQPLKFTCDVDVKPEVKLGKYKGIKVKKEPDTADQSEIDEEIKKFQENYANYETVERDAQDEDIIRCEFEVTIDGEKYEPWSRKGMGLKIGLATFGEDVDQAIIGLKVGDTKDCDTTFPDNFNQPDVAGKSASFKITIEEIREKKLPELNDELVEKSTSYKTVDEFKEAITTNLNDRRKRESQDKLHNDILEEIISNSKMEVQDVLIDRESDNTLRQFEQTLAQSGSNLQQYMQITNKTTENLKADMKEDSEKKVKSQLIIEAIAKKEPIEVSDEDFINEIKQWNLPDLQDDQKINEYLEKIDKNSIKHMIQSKKTLEFLVDNAKIK